MPQEGDFIVRIKNPKIEGSAVRRSAEPEEEAAYVAGRRKNASDAERALSQEVAGTVLPRWLQKLEEQIVTGNSGIRKPLFHRWARRANAITTQLSDMEYLRIAAAEAEPSSREEILKHLQDEQLTSYIEWLNYLIVSDGRREYEPWFRYLVLSEITKRDDRGRRRDAGTTSGVMPLSMSALARVRDDFTSFIQEYEHQSVMARVADSKDERKPATEAKTAALNALTGYPFHEKYFGYIADEAQAENEVLNYTNGWHTITDPEELSRISRGTPWCLAGLKVAHDYLMAEESKMRVYFEDGRPKIATHVVGEEVREVRGANDSQNLDPKYAEVAEEELAQYENAATWHVQAEDARTLGEIFVLCHDNPAAPLSAAQLRFLYEVDRPIKGFGYERDERIDTIRGHRSLEEDVRVIFGGDGESSIATDVEEISDATILWNNQLSSEIIEKLIAHGVENIYTAFPRGRVRLSRLAIDAETVLKYEKALAEEGEATSDIQEMLENASLTERVNEMPQQLICVEATPEALGFGADYMEDNHIYVPFEEVKQRAHEFGLEPVIAAAVPAFFFQNTHQSAELAVCMEPIVVDGSPRVFVLFLDGHDNSLLSYKMSEPDDEVSATQRILFIARPSGNN